MAKYLRLIHESPGDALRRAIEKDFAKAHDALVNRLSEFDRDDPASDPTLPSLGAAIGDRLEVFVHALATALDGVHSVRDERAAHKARIAVKRLRYLLEPVGDSVGDAGKLIARLKSLQDGLGRVHDAHTMSRAMRQALESAALAEARRASAAAPRADLDAAFSEASETWRSGGLAGISDRAAALSAELRH